MRVPSSPVSRCQVVTWIFLPSTRMRASIFASNPPLLTMATMAPLGLKSTVPPSSGPSITTHFPTSSDGTLFHKTNTLKAQVPPNARRRQKPRMAQRLKGHGPEEVDVDLG